MVTYAGPLAWRCCPHRKDIPRLRDLRIELAGGKAATHRLHVSDEVHHGTGGRVRRQIIDPTVATDPDFAPVTEAVALFSTRTNGSSPLSSYGVS